MIVEQINCKIVNDPSISKVLETINKTESSSEILKCFEELSELTLTTIENKYLSCIKWIYFQKEINQYSHLQPNLFVEANRIINSELTSIFNNIFEILKKHQPKDNSKKREKFSNLQELFRLVKASNAIEEERKALLIPIKKELKALKQEYATNSHWYIATQNNFHLKEVDPQSLNHQPQFKIDPYNITPTLKQLEAEKGIKRIRLLLEIVRKIQAEVSNTEDCSEIKSLNRSLRKAKQFIDQLPIVEQLLAITKINSVDRNINQEKELTELFDSNGKKFATYFLSKGISDVELLSSYLVTVLKDLYKVNRTLSCVEMIKQWPANFTVLEKKELYTMEYQNKLINHLFQLSNADILSPLTQLVNEYLFNFIDPTGELRKIQIQNNLDSLDKSKKNVQQNEERAKLINSLCWFGIDERLVLPQALEKPKAAKKQKFTLSDLIYKLPNKLLNKHEIAFLAQTFKEGSSRIFLTFDIDAYVKNPGEHEKLYKEVDQFFQRCRKYFEQILSDAKTKEKKKNILLNFILLAATLAMKGEYNLCSILFSISLSNDKILLENIHGIYKKSFYFLNKNILDRRKLQLVIKNNQKNVNHNPYFFNYFIDYENYKAAISSKSNTIAEIAELLKESYLTLLNNLSNLKEHNELKKWAEDHLLDDFPSLFEQLKKLNLPSDVYDNVINVLEEFLDDELTLKLKVDALVRNVHKEILLLKICYHNHETSDETKMVIDEIKKIKLENPTDTKTY